MSKSQGNPLPRAHRWSTSRCGHGCHTADFVDIDIHERYPGITVVASDLPDQHPSKVLRVCHRCGNYSATEPRYRGLVDKFKPPKRGPQLRERFWLRFFAIERWVRALLLVGVALLIREFLRNQLGFQEAWSRNLPYLNTVAQHYHFNMSASALVGDLKSALFFSPGKLQLVMWLVLVYAGIEVVEGIALWSNMRWGEWVAAAVTAAFLPYEFYELYRHLTVFKVLATGLNVALVVYLVYSKRLGVRGGKQALDERNRQGTVLEQYKAPSIPPATTAAV